ncbi:prolipoprotein diacylglyceryl transferase [Candidatus Liberibacter brunswickensis]|uniref:prolipoprotein diacylglyceryl transferase n=1 Tax=Candidatus Liberibacter brunswickensis TaxID=1968796 RepID=UPI002FE0C2D5
MLWSVLTYPNINPIAISIGFFSIRWYGLAYLIGMLFGIWYIPYLLNKTSLWTEDQNKQNIIHKEGDCRESCFFWLAISIILGGRIMYVIFYNWKIFWNFPLHIFFLWEGGMSFHGGLIGAIVSMFLLSRIYCFSFFSFLDIVATSAPVGIFLGRIANFINGELWGRFSNVPWAMIFPNGGNFPRHPSQLYEAISEGLLIFLIMNLMVYRGSLKKPGMTSGAFAICYAVIRFVMEFFREPDYQLGYLLGDWMTMGMILSVFLFIGGIVLFIKSLRI